MLTTGKTRNKRSLTLKGGFGAVIRPGGRHHSPCGDALLVHTRSPFFAIADSPDRNPWGSRDFLLQVRQMLSDATLPAPDAKSPALGADTLVKGLNELIAAVDYNANTTFTGVFLPPFSEKSTAWLFHNGDSLLFHVRRKQRSAVQLTKTNHLFVGRCQKVHQMEPFEYFPDSRFLAATDGIWDIFRNLEMGKDEGLPACILDLLCEEDVSYVPDTLLKLYDVHENTGDDLGLMVIDPNFAFGRYEVNTVL